MLGIADDNVVGVGGIGAFVNAIVGLVAGNPESFGRTHHPADTTNIGKHGFDLAGLKLQAWPIEDFLVLREQGRRKAQDKLEIDDKGGIVGRWNDTSGNLQG
jgi:hypothetical protein